MIHFIKDNLCVFERKKNNYQAQCLLIFFVIIWTTFHRLTLSRKNTSEFSLKSKYRDERFHRYVEARGL